MRSDGEECVLLDAASHDPRRHASGRANPRGPLLRIVVATARAAMSRIVMSDLLRVCVCAARHLINDPIARDNAHAHPPITAQFCAPFANRDR